MEVAAPARAPSIDVHAVRDAIRRHIRYSLGRDEADVSARDAFQALALTVRDRLVDGLLETEARYRNADAKRLYYLSMEFLIGQSLGINLLRLGMTEVCREALHSFGHDLSAVLSVEPDAALGNGGLGRLAACFIDSLATLEMPGFGYGINYEYGLFRQEIDHGVQQEKPDNWLAHGTPWQIERPAEACIVPIYGRIEHGVDRRGGYNPMWLDWRLLIGVPRDMLISGFGGKAVNYLRLYTARASEEFDIRIFNEGDYLKAVEQKMASETVSKVLYPSDSMAAGRELRLIQEYFLVACAVRDIVRRYLGTHDSFDELSSRVAIQLNDTHPALTVAELMRVLVDENDLEWDRAWEITQATLGYTNHTLMPEALERWPVDLLERVVPRHLQIIFEINRRLLEKVAATWPGDADRLRRTSLIEEGENKQVRMAHLAVVGSHSVNGVSAVHTELVKTSLVPDFYAVWPERFNNKTNGVTPRRWLAYANPGLSDLITRAIGGGWVTDLDALRHLEPLAGDEAFRDEFLRVKRQNKARLARHIRQSTTLVVDPESLFDVQTKRIHEYKRQLLNLLRIVHEYLCLVDDGRQPAAPRTCVFAGKAPPGYWAAKQIIRLITGVGQIINVDRRAEGWLKVVFLPDYRVTLAEKIIPAADLSEQISMAGTEASGTGNMKFAMNGALTIGTRDGANVEIAQEVGEKNLFLFGLTIEQVRDLQQSRTYDPRQRLADDERLRRVLDNLQSGRFSPGQRGVFGWVCQALVEHGDPYLHLADMPSYIEAHERAAREYASPSSWAGKAILNVARSGLFSSDRTIREYAGEIWDLKAVPGS